MSDPKNLSEWERIVRNAERGDHDALRWCGFLNLTAISVVVAVLVILLRWVMP